MNYIEQMMKIAECKTHPMGCTNDDVNEYTDYISNDCEGDCEDCTWYDPDEYYPEFTAEKQLELIKLISKNQIGKDYKILEIDRDEIDNLYYFSLTNKEDKCQSTYVSNQDFAQALAQLTTELMKAGELDKEKVREILER